MRLKKVCICFSVKDSSSQICRVKNEQTLICLIVYQTAKTFPPTFASLVVVRLNVTPGFPAHLHTDTIKGDGMKRNVC